MRDSGDEEDFGAVELAIISTGSDAETTSEITGRGQDKADARRWVSFDDAYGDGVWYRDDD